MKLLNAKQLCDVAAAKGFGVPALNNNGGSYDIPVAPSSKRRRNCNRHSSSPNTNRTWNTAVTIPAGAVIRMHAADTTIPMAIALDHGKTPQSTTRHPRRVHARDD